MGIWIRLVGKSASATPVALANFAASRVCAKVKGYGGVALLTEAEKRTLETLYDREKDIACSAKCVCSTQCPYKSV